LLVSITKPARLEVQPRRNIMDLSQRLEESLWQHVVKEDGQNMTPECRALGDAEESVRVAIQANTEALTIISTWLVENPRGKKRQRIEYEKVRQRLRNDLMTLDLLTKSRIECYFGY
jgi:hypothetical protein